MPATKQKSDVPLLLVVGLQTRYPNMPAPVAQDLLRLAQRRANGGTVKLSPTLTPYKEQFDAIVSVLQKSKISNMNNLSQERLSALSSAISRALITQTRAPTIVRREGVREFVPETVPRKTAPKRTEHAFNYKVQVGKQVFRVEADTNIRQGTAALSISQLRERMKENPGSIVITDSQGKKVSPGKLGALIEQQNRNAMLGAAPPKITRI